MHIYKTNIYIIYITFKVIYDNFGMKYIQLQNSDIFIYIYDVLFGLFVCSDISVSHVSAV